MRRPERGGVRCGSRLLLVHSGGEEHAEVVDVGGRSVQGERRSVLPRFGVEKNGVQLFEVRSGLIEDAQVLLARSIMRVEHMFAGISRRLRAALPRARERASEARILRRPSSRQEVIESLLLSWP